MPSAFWPAVGGVEELTRHLADALRQAGDAVEVWAPLDPHGGLPAHETCQGITLRRFSMPFPPAKLHEVVKAVPLSSKGLWQLKRAATTFRPDVLHVQCFGPNGAYATALSVLSGVPLVVTLQGETIMDDNDIFQRSSALRLALRLAFRRAAAVTACSAFTLADAQRFGLARGAGRVIYNGVALDESPAPCAPASAQQSPARPPFARYVLAVGRVVQKKGFDLLVSAFGELDLPEEVGLVIGGQGSALASLRQRAREMGLGDRVWFPGRLDRAQIAGLMRDAEVFVMPSRVEPFGIVVLEAWRASRPVVATTRGGPPEYVEDGVNGLLVDPLETAALSKAISSLLQAPERRRELGHAGHDKVALFAWPAIAKQYRDVYAVASHRSH